MPITGQGLPKDLLSRLCESPGGGYLCGTDKGNRGEKNKRLVEDKGQYQKKQDVRPCLLGGQQVLCAAFSGLPKLPPR